ncbi:MAG: type II toxin-antitoxin system HicA family toxin [Campylobacteraceae bacterium]|jgi:predicted RNA binding protein YcfA (HicA-like mRNA interferase family)|nr:type II toxin-antitoxin system HicA family toxin [Campylobacteraceae bacterium]
MRKINFRQLHIFLCKNGFKKIRQKGSHARYTNGYLKCTITVRNNNYVYNQGTLKKILMDCNMEYNQLMTYL